MGLFGKKSQKSTPTHIPESYLRGLRDYGEFMSGESGSRDYANLLADLTMMDFVRTDLGGFLTMVAAGIRSGPSHISGYVGPCCLGAVEVAADTMSIAPADNPAWDYIIDNAIAYLRESGIPYRRIKPYLRVRWDENHTPDEW